MKRKASNPYPTSRRAKKPTYIKYAYGVPYTATSSVSSGSSRRSSLSDVVMDSQIAGTVAGTAGLAFGGPAVGDVAAAVGTVAGGLYGGLKQFGVSAIKTMGNTKVVMNARANKSAMKTSGKAKVKREKKVKVTKYLKTAVKQVMQGEEATGYYRRSFSGMVGTAYNVTATGEDATIVTTVMDLPASPIALLPGIGKPVNQKTWFGGLVKSQFAGATTAITDCDLNFFTPGKIWHMASVLFNNKEDHQNPYNTTTNNLSATWAVDTGVIASSAKNLKINVKSSSAVLTMRNMSGRTQFVEIYECVSTMKFQSQGPLASCIELAKNIQDGVDPGEVNSHVGYYNGTTKLDKDTLNFLTDGTIDAVAICKNNGLKYKYKKHTMMMAPGEMCTHTVEGPSGVLDFQKLWNPEVEQYITVGAVKDWSKHLMISVRPDFILHDVSVNNGARWTVQSNTQPTLLSGLIAVEVSESIAISVPEIAGFVGTGSAASAKVGQPLNLRRDRIVINNLTDKSSYANLNAFIYASEENPVAISSSTRVF